MRVLSFYRNLSTSRKIYLSVFVGLVLGMFFGNLCEVLEPVNTLFIRLFQIAIIPYMIFSIIHSIGSLTVERAKRVGRKGGLVLICLWAVSIIFAFGLQFSFPDIQRSKFFRPDGDIQSSGINFFDLFIPSNPFYSFANGYIPAIVIFCILLGITMIKHQNKSNIVSSAQVWASLMNNLNDHIMLLLPLGVLVMSTFTFGTLSIMKLKGILLYILASIFYIVFISMIIYPIILSAACSINYKKFLHLIMPAALIGFSTGSVFLALPVIYKQMYKFNEENNAFEGISGNYKERGRNAISILVPLAWVVPASYKFLVIFFVVFSYWYYDRVFPYSKQLLYFIGGIPCLFGSNSVVVPFLLELSGDIPNRTYDIFMIVSSFLVYFNNANGAVFVIVVTILCYYSLSDRLKINWIKLLTNFFLSILFFCFVIGGLSILMTKILSGNDEVKEELTHMNVEPYNQKYYENITAEYLSLDQYRHRSKSSSEEPLLDTIVRTQILQIGYEPEAIPFSFFNSDGVLVGYDIDFIYDIAEQLHCNKIEFYPIYNSVQFKECLDNGIVLDVGVGGHRYTADSAGEAITSDPYLDYMPAIVVPVTDKKKYPDFESVLEDKEITIGRIKSCFKPFLKGKNIKDLNSIKEYYIDRDAYAFITSAEIASSMGIIYKGFWVYFYKESDIKFFYAYYLNSSPDAETFRHLINTWIDTCYKIGLSEKRYRYWVMGESVESSNKKHWSVLEWLEENNYFVGENGPEKLPLLDH
ncbi:MAG TPA: hypothetical protein DD381_08575 [Lentisphaeria bacterium]|nr:MAG: hypothetical protein A2X47_11110 [Lentisphaerae bacterium GWF2_38_69]HBM16377.1 hypothetical protein [Lentisphaeria bacterium]